MRTIHKFTLEHGRTVLDIPADAQVLAVQMQHHQPRVWVLLDPTKPTVRRFFDAYGTGLAVPDDPRLLYIGTFQMAGGSLVWHLFEAPQ